AHSAPVVGAQDSAALAQRISAIINNMIEAFDQLKKSGVTILLVEQNINFAKRLGDTVAVMDNGQVVHAGSMAALAQDEALQRSLLGLAL
ncbi:hypothetical protein ACQKEU_14210, partial [Acidovorax sp. NPDC077664]